jgi:hypothetical protein
MKIPSLVQSIKAVNTLLRSLTDRATTVPNTLVSDLLIQNLATMSQNYNAKAYYVSIMRSLDALVALAGDQVYLTVIARSYNVNVEDILSDISAVIDAFGANIEMPRNGAAYSNGSLTFYRSDAPAVDITIDPSANISELADNGVQFRLTGAPVTMLASQAASYYDSNLGLYGLTVSAQCSQTGANGNVPQNSVSKILTPVSGFTRVSNTSAFFGGADVESDAHYVSRLKGYRQALGVTTKAGIRQTILNNLPITDVYVANHGDALNLRGPGTVDVWIRESNPVTYNEPITTQSPLYGGCFIASKQPVSAIESASISCFLQKQTNNFLNGCAQANDAFRPTTTVAESLVVSYRYNKMVGDAQALFDNDAYGEGSQFPLSGPRDAAEVPLLVREAQALLVDYFVNVQIKAGYDTQAVLADVLARIQAANTYGLGVSVYMNDIGEIVEATDGVLRIKGEPSKFNLSTSTGTVVQIPAAKNQFVVLSNIQVHA